MILEEEVCSEFRISVKIGSSKSMIHTALRYFTNLGIYWDEEIERRPRKISTFDESMMKLNVRRSHTISQKIINLNFYYCLRF